MKISHLAVAGAALATIAHAQSPSGLTARELFGTVAGSKVISSVSPPPSTKTPVKTPPKATPVADNKTPPVIKEFRKNDGTVQIVTASYEGPKPLGLRYSVLQSADGQWVEASDTKVFHSGDKIRVRVESSEDAYLCILQRGSSGKWEALFPSRDTGNDNRIKAGQPRTLPSERSWMFDETKGQERLFVILSRKPFGDVDELIDEMSQAGKPARKQVDPVKTKPVEPPSAPQPKQTMLAQNNIDDAMIGRMMGNPLLSRDLVFERVDDSPKPATSATTAPKAEKAAYVVDKSGKPEARVFADIKLQHQ